MSETLKIIFGLTGGLAIFLFGMNQMSESLQKAAGEKMKKILSMLTSNPIKGVLAGALVTAVLQSSSATTVMAIGFVSAGLMSLPQAISVIFGANIGTTMTAQLIAFDIGDYIYPIIFIGFLVNFIAKKEKTKSVGMVILSFGILFLGIETMSTVMKPLASSPIFIHALEKVADIPVLGVLVGLVMTLVVQSSSATIAVLQNFAMQAGPNGHSLLGLTGAIPVLLGDNIGTTITALLASIGGSKDAKRTAIAHSIFNLSGTLLFIWFVPQYAALIKAISTHGPELQVISRQIANAHTGFNLTMTIIWTPLVWLMVKIVMKIIPDAKIANIVGEMLVELPGVFKGKNEALRKEIDEKANISKNIYKQILDYLANLYSNGSLIEEQAARSAGIMYILNEIDRIRHLIHSLEEIADEDLENGLHYSSTAKSDLKVMLEDVLQVVITGDTEGIHRLMEKKEQLTRKNSGLLKDHLKRVAKGECNDELTLSFTEIISNIDRIAANLMNILEAVSGKVNLNSFHALGESQEKFVAFCIQNAV
nr:Na/Pi cotransporter family protein [uncultured Sharpea sp.]